MRRIDAHYNSSHCVILFVAKTRNNKERNKNETCSLKFKVNFQTVFHTAELSTNSLGDFVVFFAL